MPGYTLEQLIQANNRGDGFRPSEARNTARDLSALLSLAAESMEQRAEAKGLAQELKGFSQAFKDVILSTASRDNREKVSAALKTLSGFKDFLQAEKPSGADNYTLIAEELEAIRSKGQTAIDQPGRKKGEIRKLDVSPKTLAEKITFLNYTIDLDIDDDLEKQRLSRQKRTVPQPVPQAPQAASKKENRPVPSPKEPPKEVPKEAPKAVPREVPRPAPAKAPEEPQDNLSIDGFLKNPTITLSEAGEAEELELLPDELEASPVKYEELPREEGVTLSELYEDWERGGVPVRMAVDDQGNAYADPDEIKRELRRPGRRLFLFREDGSLPHAMENRDGRLYVSDRGISAVNQAEEYSAHKKYQPKASLAPDDITKIPDQKLIRAVDAHIKAESKKIKKIQDKIDALKVDYNVAKNWITDLKENTKPPMEYTGVGRNLWRWTVKIFTLGFREPKSYREFQRKKKKWETNCRVNEKLVKEAPEQVKQLVEERKPLEEACARLYQRRERLQRELGRTSPSLRKGDIQEYRSRTEVRMEGIADIIRQGKVTPDNVFANTWLAKAACRGKTLDEPGVEEALKSYLVSRVVEERILEDAVEDREHGGPSRMIAEELNNGHLTERMEKDGIFRRMIREQGDQPVDPEEFFSEYQRRVEQREAELNHPLAKLEAERRALIQDFGQKPITKDCLRDVMRLNVLDKWIQRAKELPTDPTEVSKDDRDKIRYVLADIYKDPEKTTAANLKEFLTPEYERAIVTVGQNMSEAAEKIDESFRDLPEHQRRAWLNDTRTFTLDKMAEMVNTAVSLEKEQEKEQEKELQSGSVQSVL